MSGNVIENIRKEKNFVSAVVYVHNDAAAIEKFLVAIAGEIAANFSHGEIICVDDASTDGSGAAIKRAAGSISGLTEISLSLVRFRQFHGSELAMTAGVDIAIGDFVFEFDLAHLDFSPNLIMELYHHSLKGYDVVAAVPSGGANIQSSLFYRLFNAFAVQNGELRTERFRILSRRAINRVTAMNKAVPYRKAVYQNCGLKTDMIEYKPAKGKAGLCFAANEQEYRANLAVDALLLFTDCGYRFAKWLTCFMMLIAVFSGLYAFSMYFISSPVSGWTTTIMFVASGFFGLFLLFTVVVKYLQLLVDLVFRRQRYSFESIEKLTA